MTLWSIIFLHLFFMLARWLLTTLKCPLDERIQLYRKTRPWRVCCREPMVYFWCLIFIVATFRKGMVLQKSCKRATRRTLGFCVSVCVCMHLCVASLECVCTRVFVYVCGLMGRLIAMVFCAKFPDSWASMHWDTSGFSCMQQLLTLPTYRIVTWWPLKHVREVTALQRHRRLRILEF